MVDRGDVSIMADLKIADGAMSHRCFRSWDPTVYELSQEAYYKIMARFELALLYDFSQRRARGGSTVTMVAESLAL